MIPQSYTTDSRTKFAGYYRDGVGQDYANQRYFSGTSGGFWSPDPLGIGAVDPINCVISLYGGFLATNGTRCDKGAGSTFGAPINYAHVPIVSPFSGWYYWFQLPDVPVVSSTIRYDVP